MLRTKLRLRVWTAVASIAASIGVVGTAHAATISGVAGDVLVNHGQGFQAISSAVDVAPGGQVMVRPGGMAIISYGESCSVRVSSERIWTVQEKAPCKEGTATLDFTGRMGQSTAASQSVPWDHYLLGAALVGGAIWGIVELTDDDDDKSSKPVSVD